MLGAFLKATAHSSKRSIQTFGQEQIEIKGFVFKNRVEKCGVYDTSYSCSMSSNSFKTFVADDVTVTHMQQIIL